VDAAAKDGVHLRGSVYVPDGPGPFATVLDMSPYWNSGMGRSDKQDATVNGRHTLSPLYQDFMDAGFAVAFVALRGSGGSDGCFQFGSPLDWGDEYAVIENLGHQPWSNGAVGMYGISYAGWTQYMAIAAAPPSLKAVIPVSGVQDFWNLITRNGAPISTTPTLQANYVAQSSVGLFQDPGLLLILAYSKYYSTNPENLVPDPPSPSHFACPQYASDTPPNLELAWNGDRGPYFEARDYRPYIANTTVPVFATNGLTNGEGHIMQFDGLWDRLPAERHLMLGQWGHEFPQMGSRTDFPAMAVAWFDHYLRGGPKVVETGVVEYQDDAKAWHNTTQWPPAATLTRVFLSDGTIVGSPDAVKAGKQTFQTTPRDPSINQCGASGQGVWVSPPLAEPIEIAGNFWLNMTVSSNLPDGNMASILFHTKAADGCGAGAREVRRVLTDLRHWERTGHGRDFPTNQPTMMNEKSLPLASIVAAGDRLVLAVAGSAELTPDPRLPQLAITTGPGVVGTIDLPIVSGTLRFQ
jgi:putative CocE/NonD family hydrolase